jgi:hypothetical protein
LTDSLLLPSAAAREVGSKIRCHRILLILYNVTVLTTLFYFFSGGDKNGIVPAANTESLTTGGNLQQAVAACCQWFGIDSRHNFIFVSTGKCPDSLSLELERTMQISGRALKKNRQQLPCSVSERPTFGAGIGHDWLAEPVTTIGNLPSSSGGSIFFGNWNLETFFVTISKLTEIDRESDHAMSNVHRNSIDEDDRSTGAFGKIKGCPSSELRHVSYDTQIK